MGHLIDGFIVFALGFFIGLFLGWAGGKKEGQRPPDIKGGGERW